MSPVDSLRLTRFLLRKPISHENAMLPLWGGRIVAPHRPVQRIAVNLRSALISRPKRIAQVVVATLALVAASGGAAAEPVYSFETTPGRLPKTVVPTHY